MADERDRGIAAPPDDCHAGSTTMPEETMMVGEPGERNRTPLHTDSTWHGRPAPRIWTMLTILFCLLALALLYRFCLTG